MPISNAELMEVVRRTHPGALPSEETRRTIVFDTIRRSGIEGRLDSDESVRLRRAVEAHVDLIEPDAYLEFGRTDLYGVDIDYINACPLRLHDGRQIVLFSGLLRAMMCYIEIIVVLKLLQELRPAATMTYDGQDNPEAAAFSLAAFSILADFLIHGTPPVAFGDVLGPRALSNVKNGFAGAALFVLAHELGHLLYGHDLQRPGLATRPPPGLVIKEEVDGYLQQEFEADAFAYLAVRKEVRDIFISNVLFFLGPQSFIEAFARPGRSHPFALNRAARLASLMERDSPAAAQAGRVIESNVRSYWNLAQRRAENGGDIRYRIHETMPVSLAHSFIREIKARVAREDGTLEAGE